MNLSNKGNLMSGDYNYAAEKLSAARRILMAPHPSGEASSFAGAFHECLLGLRGLSAADFEDPAKHWFETIQRSIDTTGLTDTSGRGTWMVKIEGMSSSDLQQFSSAVDELIYWLEHRVAEARQAGRM